MYSVMLAAMLTTTQAAPDSNWRGSCYGCGGCYGCAGCYGGPGVNAFSFGGCGGCYGSCYGCYGSSCYGCYGSSCYGSACYGCYGSCYGCGGCCGGVIWNAVQVVPAKKAEKKDDKKKKDDKDDEISSPAKVTVHLPADARLTVDGVACPLTSAKRSFDTPALDAGRTYGYTLKAEITRGGEPVTLTRRITVFAGRETVVDLNDVVTAQVGGR